MGDDVTYLGRVEDPPGSGLFYLRGGDVEFVETGDLYDVTVGDEPTTLVESGGEGLYLVDGALEDVYLAVATSATRGEWSVDLCSNWERIGTADAFEFRGQLRNNKTGDWVLEIPAEVVYWTAGAVAVDVDTVRLRDAFDNIVYPGVVSFDGNGAGGYTVIKEGGSTLFRWAGNDLWEYVRRRVAFPDPMDVTPGWTVSHDTRTGPAAAVAAGYLLDNLGVGAETGRRIDGFVIDTSGQGTEDTWEARLQPLSDLVQGVCDAGGVSCRLDYADDRFVARIYTPTDWSDSYILSDKGDLSRVEVRHQPASTTWTVAGGTGEGTARLFQVSDFGGSGVDRLEAFSDQTSVDTTATLYNTAFNNNLEGAAQLFVTVDVADDAADRIPFGTVVELGDLITIEVDDVRYVVPVTELKYEITADRQRVQPVLGTAAPDALTRLARDVDDLASRFGRDIA